MSVYFLWRQFHHITRGFVLIYEFVVSFSNFRSTEKRCLFAISNESPKSLPVSKYGTLTTNRPSNTRFVVVKKCFSQTWSLSRSYVPLQPTTWSIFLSLLLCSCWFIITWSHVILVFLENFDTARFPANTQPSRAFWSKMYMFGNLYIL